MFAGEESAGASEARGNLVEDDQHVVLTAELHRLLKVARMVEPHSACTLHDGLQD